VISVLLNEREETAALQREFDAYRKAHSVGDELAELGATVEALYEKMK